MRRRAFAQSVVVTFSLAELACTSSAGQGPTVNPPPPPADDGQDDGQANADADDGGLQIGPADDGGGAAADGGADGGSPPPTEIGPAKTTINKRPDGTCWEVVSIDCPPGVACNPPPPKEVDCAEAELPEATIADNVHTRDDGTCWEHANVVCQPGATCNPPPPQQVRCPSTAK